MRLTLLHKGLLLVSIPLCFEITIFGVLINLQNQAEAEAQRVNRNKHINDAVNRILRDTIYVGKVQTLYSVRGFSAVSFLQHIDDIRQNFKELDDLTRYDPELNKSVQTCKQAMDRALADIDFVRHAIRTVRSEDLPSLIKDSRQKLDANLQDVLSSGFLNLAEKSLEGTDDEVSHRLREKIRFLLKWALGLSIFLGIFGATMFSMHLAGRLHRLSLNAQHLAKNEPLLPLQGGTDEVAELDKSFHYAADLISQATRMRQEVTAMITHDLKTPLQSIRSFFEMLHHGMLGELNEQGTNLLTLSEKESIRMVGLIDSVLQLEKIRSHTVSLKITEIAIGTLLDKTADAVQVLADEKSIELRREYAQSKNETIQGDSFWLEQVLVNILSNAIKFSPPKTFVTITVQPTTAMMVVRISDKGPGIPKEERKLVFERFHRVASTSGDIAGSGLGLTISKELVELHHGSIDVESEVGSGSTFNIRLPRTAPNREGSREKNGENLTS